jgi:hypothetical protein
MRFIWKFLATPSKTKIPRRSKRMAFSWDGLEERKVLSQAGGLHHIAAIHATSASTSSTTASSTLSTAKQTLQTEIQTVLSTSGTTIGELSALHISFQTLQTAGLKPTSGSALTSFENSLVTSFASGTTLTGNATLLAQFEALYSASPTAQQTTDLTTAYNALAAAVTSAGVTSADITAINTDFSAVLTAASSTSTATFPYFTLVTGGLGGFGGIGGFGNRSMGGGRC